MDYSTETWVYLNTGNDAANIHARDNNPSGNDRLSTCLVTQAGDGSHNNSTTYGSSNHYLRLSYPFVRGSYAHARLALVTRHLSTSGGAFVYGLGRNLAHYTTSGQVPELYIRESGPTDVGTLYPLGGSAVSTGLGKSAGDYLLATFEVWGKTDPNYNKVQVDLYNLGSNPDPASAGAPIYSNLFNVAANSQAYPFVWMGAGPDPGQRVYAVQRDYL